MSSSLTRTRSGAGTGNQSKRYTGAGWRRRCCPRPNRFAFDPGNGRPHPQPLIVISAARWLFRESSSDLAALSELVRRRRRVCPCHARRLCIMQDGQNHARRQNSISKVQPTIKRVWLDRLRTRNTRTHHHRSTHRIMSSEATNGATTAAAVPEGVLLGMGNPLLDISADVPQEVLDKCVVIVVFFFLSRRRFWLIWRVGAGTEDVFRFGVRGVYA